MKNNSSSFIGVVEINESTPKKIIMPLRNLEERSYNLQAGESIEIVCPKSKPWLDWQVNLPDNKPKDGSEVIAKFFGKYNFKYDTVIFLMDKWFGGSDVGMHDDDVIEKWAYIPE